MNDDSITRRLLLSHAGDDAVLRHLVEQHLPWIEARVRKRLGREVRNEGDTHDFVQEALLEVLREGPRLSVENTAAFRGLLARVVEHTLIDRQRYMHREQRDRRRQCELPSDSVLALAAGGRTATSPPLAAERSEQRAWLRLALELLDPDDREVLRLRDWEELSFRAAGERLGLTEEATRKRYLRALPRLAKKLELLRRGRWQDVLDGDRGSGAADGAAPGAPPPA